jgi:hypothetical protein
MRWRVPKSFLAKLAEPQQSRRDDARTRYDPKVDMSFVRSDGVWTAAIDHNRHARTKKADIEKGEDQKDRWR